MGIIPPLETDIPTPRVGRQSKRGGFSPYGRRNDGLTKRNVCHQEIELLTMSSMDLEHEKAWLRGLIIRLRTLLQSTTDAQVKTELKDLISEARRRLEVIKAPAL